MAIGIQVESILDFVPTHRGRDGQAAGCSETTRGIQKKAICRGSGERNATAIEEIEIAIGVDVDREDRSAPEGGERIRNFCEDRRRVGGKNGTPKHEK
jgi:hypothetical protein